MYTTSFRVITAIDMRPLPNDNEMMVAIAMARYFMTDVRFVQKGISHTPDIYLVKQRQYWEIKNVRGNSKRTIDNLLRSASKQSCYIVLSLANTTMNVRQATGRIKHYLNAGPTRIKKIVIVVKDGRIIEI